MIQFKALALGFVAATFPLHGLAVEPKVIPVEYHYFHRNWVGQPLTSQDLKEELQISKTPNQFEFLEEVRGAERVTVLKLYRVEAGGRAEWLGQLELEATGETDLEQVLPPWWREEEASFKAVVHAHLVKRVVLPNSKSFVPHNFSTSFHFVVNRSRMDQTFFLISNHRFDLNFGGDDGGPSNSDEVTGSEQACLSLLLN